MMQMYLQSFLAAKKRKSQLEIPKKVGECTIPAVEFDAANAKTANASSGTNSLARALAIYDVDVG